MPPAFRPLHPVFAAEVSPIVIGSPLAPAPLPRAERGVWIVPFGTIRRVADLPSPSETGRSVQRRDQREKIRFLIRLGTRRAILLAMAAVESSEPGLPGQ
jgi:hypothetical protein